jgi:enoyl-CoA hydratase/carnithine racemase
MSSDLVLTERKDRISFLTLNRPRKKNAMSNDLLDQLIAELNSAIADEEVNVIVLRGAGDCFTSGRDISQFQDDSILQDGSIDETVDIFLHALSLLVESPKPTIASIHGLAIGGGQAMSLACDFVVAERGAKFGNIEMAYGFPAAMNIAFLTRHIGRRRGLEIAISGNMYSAEEYERFGLVNRLADLGELEQATLEFASMLASREHWAVRRTKSHYRSSEDMTFSGALTFGNQLNQLLRMNEQIEQVHKADDSVKQKLKTEMLRDE